jgi:ATP-dependent Clp protease adaptor protein ClpS
MDFVIHILEKFFHKDSQEATEIMLNVHRRGAGLCGVYTFEIAETKVNQVMDYARSNEQPLQCTMEKE